ncbi:hypothetical protein GEMRC1_005163 [Eukaryota sp. GEM-RC1]
MSLIIACCQRKVLDSKRSTFESYSRAIRNVASLGAELIILPECFHTPYHTESFPNWSEPLDGETALFLQNQAQKFNVHIVGGTFIERDDDQLYNTTLVYSNHGELIAKYRKMHLFDIDIPGKIQFFESSVLSPGESLAMFDLKGFKIGLGICFDLRFPSFSQKYRDLGANVLLFPGSFNMTTGPLHWELLLRARAVDNGIYVVGASPARDENSSYISWSHSMVVNPFGNVLHQLEGKGRRYCGNNITSRDSENS